MLASLDGIESLAPLGKDVYYLAYLSGAAGIRGGSQQLNARLKLNHCTLNAGFATIQYIDGNGKYLMGLLKQIATSSNASFIFKVGKVALKTFVVDNFRGGYQSDSSFALSLAG